MSRYFEEAVEEVPRLLHSDAVVLEHPHCVVFIDHSLVVCLEYVVPLQEEDCPDSVPQVLHFLSGNDVAPLQEAKLLQLILDVASPCKHRLVVLYR